MPMPAGMRVAVALMCVGAVTSLLTAATILLYREQMIADASGRISEVLSTAPFNGGGGTPESSAGLGIVLGVAALVVLAGLWVFMAGRCAQGRSGSRAWATALGGLGLLVVVSRLAQEGSSYPWNAAAWAGTGVLAAVILVLIWLPTSTVFFDDRHRQLYPPPTSTG